MVRIIVVHGRGTKPSFACKLRYVREVLTESVRRIDPNVAQRLSAKPWTIQLAYYADLFRRLSGEAPDECASYREPIDRLYEESRTCPTWLKFRGLMQDVGVDVTVRLMEFLKPSARRRMFASQFADVRRYFQDRRLASRIRQRLYALLVPALRRWDHVLVIAHSFGSVVAFDALWELSYAHRRTALRDRQIAGFVTMGSPLGDKVVKAHLLGSSTPIPQRYPTNIARWANLSARGDMICHDARLANDFHPMVQTGLLERIEEHTGLCTVYRSREGVWNPHKLYGYLILPEVGRLVARFLES